MRLHTDTVNRFAQNYKMHLAPPLRRSMHMWIHQNRVSQAFKSGSEDEPDNVVPIYWRAVDTPVDTN